jgi:FkbM family methyltransferase
VRLKRALGIGRSLATYYAIPLRARRLARFYSRFVPSGALCFDIGAHVGNRTRCWLRLGARVVAVEPQPELAALLRRLYGRDPKVTIEQSAVADEPGTARLLLSESTPSVSTLSREWIHRVRASPSFRRVRWTPGQEVPVTTLDALIARHGRPWFVKIDVEGYEARVLAGLNESLPCLSFEYLPAAREMALACVERLSRLGSYRFNWSAGESHRLGSTTWMDETEIRRFIEALTEESGSGDVYARLAQD